MQHARIVCECQCNAKFSGVFSQSDVGSHTKYKSAVVQALHIDNTNSSLIRVTFKCNPNKSYKFNIWNGRKSEAKKIIARDKVLLITLKDTNLYVNVDKPQKGFDQLSQWVLSTSKGESENEQRLNGRRERDVVVLTPQKAGASDDKHSTSNHDSTSPFTHVKTKRHSQHFENSTKENQQIVETPPKKTSGASSFLSSAEEKSSRVQDLFSPGAACAKKFYGSTDGSRNYGSFATAKKTPLSLRKPGFLDVNDKRPPLSNVNNSIQYSWGNKTTPSKTPTSDKRSNAVQGLGFSNLGNTCYMNAILQSLLGLNSFTRDLMALASRLKQEDHLHSSLAYQIAKLFVAKKRSMSRERQKEYLAGVKQAVSKTARRFSGNEQHDAHELLSQMLDQMKEDLARENKAWQKRLALKNAPSPGSKPDLDNIELAPEAPQTDIHDVTKDEFVNPALLNFEFEVMHTIACLKCSEEVKKTETFHDLSLDMPKRANAEVTSTIQDALDQFFQSEQIEYTCENCGHKQVQVYHQFYRLPRVLVLHLKRYQYNALLTSHRKVRRDIDIPRYLTLLEHTSQHTYPPYDFEIAHAHGATHDDSIVIPDENCSPLKPDVNSSSEPKPKRLSFFRRSAASTQTSLNNDSHDASVPNAKKPSFERSCKDTPQLRQALLSDDQLDNENDAHSSDQHDLHNKTISNIDLTEYTNNMSEEEQMKHALEMSLQETTNGSSAFDSGTNENAHNNCNFTNGSNANTSGTNETLSHNMCNSSSQTPSKSRFEDPDLKTYSRKRRSKSRCHIRFSSDDENAVETETENKRCKTQTNGVHSSSNFPCTVSKPSDMLSALDENEKHLTPLKNTHLNKSRSSSTPKRLDDIFSKCELKSKEKLRTFENDTVGSDMLVDLTGLEEEFNHDMNYRAQDLNPPAVGLENHTSQSNLKDDRSQRMDEKGGRVLSKRKESFHDIDRDDNILNAATLNNEFGSIFIADESPSKSTTTWSANKLSVKKLKLSSQQKRMSNEVENQNGIISKYFNDQTDNDVEKRISTDDGVIKRECASEIINEHQERGAKEPSTKTSPSLAGLPRHVFDPAMTPRLSDTCFDDDDDEKTNVKPDHPEEQTEKETSDDRSWIKESRDKETEEEDAQQTEPIPVEWQNEKAKEDEDLQKALQNSMLDQGDYDEDMKKAIELSLKDLNEQDGLPWEQAPAEEESFLRDADTERSHEDRCKLEANLESGELEYSYRLVSVVSHLGSSSAGHYIADVYNSADKAWYSYDDSHVDRMSEQAVRASRTRTGYIFFYVNKEVQKEIESRQTVSPGSKENRQSTVPTPSKPSNRVLQPLGLSNQSQNTLPRRPVSR